MPLNEKLRGPLAKNSDQNTALPLVFLVGNHSSGKSSFVNFIMGRNVQTAGVAPTDDNFTVIAPGPEDIDQDGPALIGDPDMGFGALRQFGPTLIHHTQLKVRKDVASSNFMLVDSPGMIDSPVSSQEMDRGYDFKGVVKYFADRADVVLLFFDPDKPGTTGETLSVLLHSLGGMDHKLLIVLNKADQFKKIHDFARAYGSLCWNLSKVIPRKDLPRIYTMCLPVKESSPAIDNNGLADLHQTRNDVVAEVMKAPKRRIDNVITHLNDSVHLLLMHAKIVQETNRLYSARVWECRMQEGGCLVTGVGLTALGVYTSLPVEFTGGVIAATVLGVGGLSWFNRTKMAAVERQLVSAEELSASFQRTHAREVSEADEFTASVWQRIRDPLRMSLQSLGLANTPTVSQADLNQLHDILEKDIPALRRLASPTHFGSKQRNTEYS
jgi:GTP-binding protein EngB required for normal cell division